MATKKGTYGNLEETTELVVEDEPKKKEEKVLKMFVACPVLNVRSEPSKESSVIGLLYEGDEVIVKSKEPNNGFVEVDLQDTLFLGSKCFVMKEFLSSKKEK